MAPVAIQPAERPGSLRYPNAMTMLPASGKPRMSQA